jgi:hypothetical protein
VPFPPFANFPPNNNTNSTSSSVNCIRIGTAPLPTRFNETSQFWWCPSNPFLIIRAFNYLFYNIFPNLNDLGI